MDQQQMHALRSLRERIRAVCVHDQVHWDATWKEALGDFSRTRRGLIPPDVFFEVLEANSVFLVRSEARRLLLHFQEQNGAIAAAKFLRWVALTPPTDHMNPDLLFPQLPQPYRRIKKVFDHDIFDAAWEIITRESVRFKAEGSAAEGVSGQPQVQQKSDLDAAKRRCCEPTWQLPLDNNHQVIGLASHCLLPLVIAGINSTAFENSAINGPMLRAVSTANGDATVVGDFPIEFPPDTQTPEGRSDSTVYVVIKQLTALQLLSNGQGGACCCLAVRLVETTSVGPVGPEAQPPAPTVRECVNVYAVRLGSLQHPNSSENPPAEFSCELLAVIRPTQGSVASIVLSPDSVYIAVTSFSSAVVVLYCLQPAESTKVADAEHQPLLLSAPTFQADLTATRSHFAGDEAEPQVHFLVAPATSRIKRHAHPSAPPNTYSIAVCYGHKVLQFLLPSSSTSPASFLTPAKSWENLTSISASAQDITTQYLVVGCEDGTIVVWDVLQNIDYAFLSPIDDEAPTKPTQPNVAMPSSVVFSPTGHVVALSTSQQRLYFFDVRERGRSTLIRVVSPPGVSSSTTNQPSSHSVVVMAGLELSTVIPVALVTFSNGMILLYDVRNAEAVGSIWSATPAASSLITHQESNAGMSIVGNQEMLAVATLSTPSMEAGIKFVSWHDILLVCFPFFENVLHQREEEMTTASIKQLFLSRDAESAIGASTIAASAESSDFLHNMFLKMAGETPVSPEQAPRAMSLAALSPTSPLGQSSACNIPRSYAPSSQFMNEGTNRRADTPVQLEPLVPDATSFFAEYCSLYLDPLVTADKEAKLHRKRRELLKTMSAGGTW